MVGYRNFFWRIWIILVFLSLPACSSSAQSVELQKTAMLPEFQQIPQNLNTYTIQVDLDFAAHSYQGNEKVDYTNTEAEPLDELYFRLFPNGGKSFGAGKLEVSNLRVGHRKVNINLAMENTVLEIKLPKPLQPGEHAQITMDFNGLVPVPPDSSDKDYFGIFGFSDNILTMAGWFPILAVYDSEGWNLDRISSYGDSVYSEAAYFDVTIMGDSKLILATTGIATSQNTNKDQTETHVVTGPVRDFSLVASPDFEVTTAILEGVKINAYSLPHYSLARSIALQDAKEALEIFNDKFGAYPYTELDIVQTPLTFDGGVEYPGLVFISGISYEKPLEMSYVISHEVAHQWWYGVVGDDQIDDPWMDEALAEYSVVIFDEIQYGVSSYDAIVTSLREGYETRISQGENVPITKGVFYFEDKGDPDGYFIFVYIKGALFFDVLREQVGDEMFFKALETYYQTHLFQTVRSQDLMDTFETISGKQLDGLYQEWLLAK